MALLHRVELRPSKIELISAWAPTQPWFVGDATAPLTNIASFRFDPTCPRVSTGPRDPCARSRRQVAASSGDIQLTTVHQPSEAMGATMAQMMLSLLRGEPVEHQCIMQTHIVERDSA